MRQPRLCSSLVLSLVFASALASCSSEEQSGIRGPDARATYRDPGPYAAGVTTLTLADRMVEVWYPANPADVDGMEPYSYFIRDELSQTSLPLPMRPACHSHPISNA